MCPASNSAINGESTDKPRTLPVPGLALVTRKSLIWPIDVGDQAIPIVSMFLAIAMHVFPAWCLHLNLPLREIGSSSKWTSEPSKPDSTGQADRLILGMEPQRRTHRGRPRWRWSVHGDLQRYSGVEFSYKWRINEQTEDLTGAGECVGNAQVFDLANRRWRPGQPNRIDVFGSCAACQ